MRQKAKGTRPGRNLARRAARRTTLPGYPVEPCVFTIEEADAYLAGDKIVCLLCGKPYRKLGVHLRAIHAVEPDEYRERYGLPYRDGLCGEETKALHSALARRLLAEGKVVPVSGEEFRARVDRAGPARQSAYKRQMGSLNGLAAHGQDRLWEDADYREFVRRMLSGRRVAAVARDADMPKQTQFFRWSREHPEFRRWMGALIEAAPFPVQALLGRLGPRFDEEARKLREAGLHFGRIAARLGVTTMTVHKHLARHGAAGPS